MTDTTKKQVLELVEKLVKDNKTRGELYNYIVATAEKSVAPKKDDWLEAAKPSLTIHRKPFVECEACSA